MFRPSNLQFRLCWGKEPYIWDLFLGVIYFADGGDFAITYFVPPVTNDDCSTHSEPYDLRMGDENTYKLCFADWDILQTIFNLFSSTNQFYIHLMAQSVILKFIHECSIKLLFDFVLHVVGATEAYTITWECNIGITYDNIILQDITKTFADSRQHNVEQKEKDQSWDDEE